jgi:hypothetical protein
MLASGAKKSFLLGFGAKASTSLDADARLIFDGTRRENHTVCRPTCPPLDADSEFQSKPWSDSLHLPETRAVPIKVRFDNYARSQMHLYWQTTTSPSRAFVACVK